MKQADDIHLTDEAIVFLVCRVYMMVAVVSMGSRVIFGGEDIMHLLHRGSVEERPEQKKNRKAFNNPPQFHRSKGIEN